MNITTGHRTFDRQSRNGEHVVLGCACMTPVMFGGVVRSRDDVDCVEPRQPGQLQDWDIRRWHEVNGQVESIARRLADEHDGVMLYHVFHHRNNRKIINGYLIRKDAQTLCALVMNERARCVIDALKSA